MKRHKFVKKIFILAALIFFTSVFYSFGLSTQTISSDNAPTPHEDYIAEPANDALIDAASTEQPSSGNDIVASSNTAVDVGKPVRLIIPYINVDANVEHLGLTDSGAVQAPDGAKDVSWFNLGPRPGEKGSAVISGHYGIWKNGTKSVFNLLPNLKPGDDIYVKDDNGATHSFTVKETRVYNKDETVPEIFNKDDNAYLNIITCHGTWLADEKTYSQRLVVFAEAK